MKTRLLLAGITLSVVLSGCSSTTPAGSTQSGDPVVPKQIKIEHIHGLAYSLDGSSLYLAAHDGLYQMKSSTWAKVGKGDIDLMGFSASSGGIMLTSGHPGKNTKLPDPVGLLASQNNGETWQPISLTGKVDFHILTINKKNPNVVYALNQIGEGEYPAGIYKSEDDGKTWKTILPYGLPSNLQKVLNLVSDPDHPEVLLAGTEEGFMKSENSGYTWNLVDKSHLITALEVLPKNPNGLLAYSVTNKEGNLVTSKDQGKSWEKVGLELGQQDAVTYVVINPNDNKEMAAATYENSVYVSKDGGKKWVVIMDKGKSR